MIRGKTWARIELALVGLTLFMFTEAFLGKLLAPGAENAAAEESSFLRMLWLPFYALVGVGLVACGKKGMRAVLAAPLLVGLVLLAFASSGWSIDPAITFRRSVALAATTAVGLFLAARYDWLGALRALAGMWLVLLAVTLVAGIVFPGFSRMTEVHVGAWAGGWWEKNQLGGHAARASLLFAFLAWRDVAHRRVWCVALIISVLLVILSTSATALLGTMFGFAVLAIAWWVRRGKRHALLLAWGGIGVGGVIAMMFVLAPGMVLAAIGRDPTFTGRTDIWDELARYISMRPIGGFGYAAFWDKGSEPRYWIGQALAWNAPSGHNGWLDLAISVGLLGVVLFAIDVVLTLGRAAMLSLRSPVGVFVLGAAGQFLIFSMSESIVLTQNSIIWATWVFVSAKLAMTPIGDMACDQKRLEAMSARLDPGQMLARTVR